MPVFQIRNYLCVLASILAASAPATSEEGEDVIARCAQIASVGDRILCLEDALRPAAGDSRENEIPIAVEPVAQDNTTAAISDTSDDTIDAAVEITSAAAASAGKTETEQFGLDKAQKNPDPLTSIDVIVVAVSKSAYGKLIFTTGSGQVWQQTDHGSPRYRQIPFEATLRKGAAGSFFIQPQSGGVAVRVKRR